MSTFLHALQIIFQETSKWYIHDDYIFPLSHTLICDTLNVITRKNLNTTHFKDTNERSFRLLGTPQEC